mgnify:CR=1 FL=1
MKNKSILTICSLLCATIFFQCTNKPAPTDSEATTASTTATEVSKIEGYWVNDAWWQSLLNTRSPKKAAEFAEIAAADIHLDSGQWVADMAYNWHEGMRYTVQASGGKFALINATDDGSKAHEIEIQPDGSIHLDTFAFVRIGDSKTGFAVISATILGGTYTLKGKNTKVVLNADGTVSGLAGYARYELLTDYITDQVVTDDGGADQMMLYKTDSDLPEFFVFKLEGGQMSLFPLIEKEEEQIYVPGKVRYVLVKATE